MKLDIILQTHSISSVHGTHRYVDAPKSEIMLRCAQSLVNSINEAEGDIVLHVLDDHSAPEHLEQLKKIIAGCRYPTNLIALEGHGYNASALAMYAYGRDHGREVVYFVEDDYLHTRSAVQEMIDVHQLFKKNLGGREVALHPYDDTKNYWTKGGYGNEMCRIVYGHKRHWRTNTHTTNTCWVEIETVRRNWELFETLALYSSTPYGDERNIYEGTTINKIWREQVVLFTPILSLALHLQFEEHKDPYIDWRAWWDAAQY